MGSLEKTAMDLTGIERAGPKTYIRQIFPLKLDENYDIEKTQKENSPGCLRCRGFPEDRIGLVTVKDLRAPHAFPFTFDQIRARKFSLSCFDDAVLLNKSIWPSVTNEMPATSLQINYIRGGVLLGWCTLHMIGDAFTYFVWAKVWAEECRRMQGIEISDPFVLDDAMVTDREIIMKATGRHNGKAIEPYLGIFVVPVAPTSVPAGMLSPTHRAQIFYFSPESLAALKADANDAFAALNWRATMSVQAPVESLKDGEEEDSIYAIAVNLRARSQPLAHPHALGCWLGYLAVRAPIRKLLTVYNLADIAGLVRNRMEDLDNNYADKMLSIIDNLDDVNRFVPTVFFNMMSTSILATSWADSDLYNVVWGPMFGGKIEAVRMSNSGISPGTVLVLPRLPKWRAGTYGGDRSRIAAQTLRRSCLYEVC
ncbi:hypothetical protein CMQ_2573 [Grosmannia clavigera kw1407]|uniref:Trichothecene 3-O-acetyltransferase-like N-terminal domain-containing protein n=1 Tax=Grosmannia clavigera (strain kw1407 / UAMH 11150) TaxID=655863 RepID=F0XH48_GROCL|nr:uncharacterized protein CMQ_2573 [Grosmannia clavigera kw1407]EFX02644.1 hypothetical protein CMQ_2573 [Grosmannia clavigera kw1407]